MSTPDLARIQRHNQSTNERITPSSLNRISILAQRNLMSALATMLVRKDTGEHLALNNLAFIGDSCRVYHVSGDRATGVTFRVQAGIGIRRVPGANAVDETSTTDVYEPLVVEAPFTFVTNGSDVAQPRIDRVFLRNRVFGTRTMSVDIIDPVTKNITSETRSTERNSKSDNTNDGFAYVVGTPAASPVGPAAPVGYTLTDLVAEIRIDPGGGSFDTQYLTDKRVLLEVHPSAAPGLGSIEADDIGVAAPLVDAHVQDALERLDAELDTLGASAVRGLLYHGGVVYTDTATVTLRRGAGRGGSINAEIAVEIDGTVYTKTDSDLAFSMVTHIEGTEAASTWYYLYLSVSGSTLVPHLSATAPVMPGAGGKVGYHPTQTAWRFVGDLRKPATGACFNDASSNLVDFRSGDQWSLAAKIPAAWLQTPANPGTGTYAALDLSAAVPTIAREVLVRLWLVRSSANSGGTEIHLGPGSIIGAPPGSTGMYLKTAGVGSNDGGDSVVGTFWVALDSSRRISWIRAGDGADAITLAVLGWR